MIVAGRNGTPPMPLRALPAVPAQPCAAWAALAAAADWDLPFPLPPLLPAAALAAAAAAAFSAAAFSAAARFGLCLGVELLGDLGRLRLRQAHADHHQRRHQHPEERARGADGDGKVDLHVVGDDGRQQGDDQHLPRQLVAVGPLVALVERRHRHIDAVAQHQAKRHGHAKQPQPPLVVGQQHQDDQRYRDRQDDRQQDLVAPLSGSG